MNKNDNHNEAPMSMMDDDEINAEEQENMMDTSTVENGMQGISTTDHANIVEPIPPPHEEPANEMNAVILLTELLLLLL